MGQKLTNKQALFAKHYASGKSGKKSAVLAGYSTKSAEVIASENLRKPQVLERIERILDKAGLTDEVLAEKLKASIDAGLGVGAKNADAIKGIKMAYELRNRFPAKKQETTNNSKVEVMMSGKSVQEIRLYIEETTAKTQAILAKLKQLE